MEKREDEMRTAETVPVNAEKGKKGKIIIIVIAVLFLLLIGYRIVTNYVIDKETDETVAVNVKTATAQMGSISVEAPVTAKIEAGDEVAIVPMVAGKVTSVNVKVGDKVSKGQTLFTIDDTQVRNGMAQANEALSMAATTLNRMTVLYNEGAISQADYDSAKLQYDNAVITAQNASSTLSYYTVTAPISGCITALSVTEGGVASQGMMGTIVDTSTLEINTTVTENLARKINVGDAVDVYISSLDKTVQGRVKTFSKIPGTGTVTYPVTISLSGAENDLMAGMFAEVRIKSEESNQALIVPSEAVIIKNGETVVVTLKDKLPVINVVEVGIDNGEQAEILSGIKAGDTVVVVGQQYVKEGEEVNIVE